MKYQMHNKDSPHGLDCKGELLNRVFGGIASSAEQQSFDVHVEHCESCRLSQQLNRDFAQIGAASDDSGRIARIAAVAMQARPRNVVVLPIRKRKPAVRLALVALALGGSAAAAAGVSSWFQMRGPTGPLHRSADSSQLLAPPAPLGQSRDSKLSDPQTETERESPLPSADGARLNGAQVAITEPSGASVPNRSAGSGQREFKATAQAIFRDANQARRGGDTAHAIKLYEQLQRQFPRSPEASLSQVTLGRLLLQSGVTKTALAHFNQYLQSGSTKSLAAEALYGRGQALQALGRSSDEAENWRRLLSSYPRSPYSEEARQRLRTLR